jgi:hypothetical protein
MRKEGKMAVQVHYPRHLQFRFSRAGDETPAVPASLLIQTLEGAQRAIWLIALAKEEKDIKSRARIPAEIEQRYQLKCDVPQPGSYLLPTFVESVQPQLISMDQVENVVGTFAAVADALQRQDRDEVAQQLPDTAIRKRVVDAFQHFAPKPGSGWRLELSRNGTTVRMDDGWQRLIRRMYAPKETEPDRETVNGELIEINFADRQITILPIGSNRQLKITYQDAMEDFLLENRRAVIQITGRVSRDENGELKNMFDLESMSPLDLSPLEINEVEHDGMRLRFRQPAHLVPQLSEDNPQFVRIEEPSLGLDAFAGTVTDLVDEVAEDLVVVWKNYARAEDADLAPKALELKRRLLASLDEVPIGG